MAMGGDIYPRRGPDQIRNRQFVWVRKGYDPDQVQDFLKQVADMVDGLEAELNRAKAEVEKASRTEAAAREHAYTELANRMADLLRVADAHAETLRREAEQEAERIQAEARTRGETARTEAEDEAKRIRTQALEEGERVLREAKAEAERYRRENAEALKKARAEAEHIVNVLASRRDKLLAEIQSTRERLSSVLQEVNQAVPPVPMGPGPSAAPPGKERPSRRGAPEPVSSEPLELVLPEIPALEEELEG